MWQVMCALNSPQMMEKAHTCVVTMTIGGIFFVVRSLSTILLCHDIVGVREASSILVLKM